MDMSQYLALNSRAQIITLIEKGALYGGDIWQGKAEGKQGNYLSQIIQIHYDIRLDKVILRTPSIVQPETQETMFIRLNYRNIIFRLYPGEFKVIGDKIICSIPDEARALEERKGGDRYVLPFSSEISLSLKRMERNFREMTYEMEMRIIDVSEKGFGIMISSQNRQYFMRNDHFWLRAVDHQVLRTPVLGCVKYVAPKGYYLKRGDVRVGLSLSLPLEKELFEYLKRKSFLILSA